MKFIKLHDVNFNEEPAEQFWLNAEMIESMYERTHKYYKQSEDERGRSVTIVDHVRDYTQIIIHDRNEDYNENCIDVQETPEKILELIDEAEMKEWGR
jgi:hypothetical protein